MDDNITNGEVFNQPSEKTPSIDELQQLILQKMTEDNADEDAQYDDVESTEEFEDEVAKEFGSSLENEYYDISPIEKKYVISISSDVVPYFEKIEPEERAELVNQLVLEHIEKERKIPEELNA